MQGKVIFFDQTGSNGLISGADGKRYAFHAQNLKQAVQPSVGAEVDFEPSETEARDIYILSPGAAGVTGVYTGGIEPDCGFFAYGWRAATRKYLTFSGRARRKEFWAFSVVYLLLLLLATMILVPLAMAGGDDMAVPLVILLSLLMLSLTLPAWAVSFRRLHDIGQPGWILILLVVLGAIPYIGPLISLVGFVILGAVDGQTHENSYGVPVKRS